MRVAATTLLAVLCILLGAPCACAEEITVAAAADLQFVMQELAAQFEKQTGHKITVTAGSSGSLFSQVQNGAPFDLFFSADVDYPRKLEAAGFAEPGTLVTYVIGRIVIWVPENSRVDVSRGWRALLDPTVQKVSVANPQHAPYGRAAVAALRKTGMYDKVEAKLVYGENVSQAAQFVESGNAQAGIIALSLAVSPALREKGRWWEIPAETYAPIAQGAIVLKSSPNKQTARAFLDFVRSAQGRALLERNGFTVPRSESASPTKP
jgi:molybdate transport system substrate-binding protein